ncbi:sugar ABC transporter permease [Infirmifilum lucidum]|uniref:Sugar ABC transporter permease n=1 Tax=Infirmifilum lucidum TaxID=2776706 RepID=A0A7L9FH72_9CREN|nr:sugar ABC transporter permease [Infirmifilum lucidum]QOJ79150.1 sugar ABC transporter permease [Infirmifilum lucidum]
MASRRRLMRIAILSLMLIPATLVIVVFMVVPAVLTILMSLTNLDYRFIWEWVGLANYQKFVTDINTLIFVRNTIIYVAGTLAFNVGMGLLLALVSTHIHDTIGTLMRALWYLPRVMPSVIYAFIMMWIFSPMDTGFLNTVIRGLGGQPVPWTFKYYWPFLFIVNGFIGCSFGMVIFSSAIKAIPQDYIIAAKVDGASQLTIVRRIILPLIKWHIAFVVAYQTLSLLASFEYILLTLDGGPGYYSTEVMILQAYHLAFGQYLASMRYGYAAVFVSVLLVIGLVLSIVYWKVFRLRELMAEPKME